jgi:geranylgeranyl diphosphate synthase type II
MLDDRQSLAGSMSAVEDAMRRVLGDGPAAALACRHLESGGGRVRARLCLATAQGLRLSPDIAVALAAATELLHNAALVHDDIQDRDSERRGHPALWVSAGVGSALCAGDLMISAAYAALSGLTPGAPVGQAIALLHGAVAETILGQSRDLAAGSGTSFDAALTIAAAKSGPLIALPVRLALLLARAPGDDLARQAAAALAVGYQIADDLVDLPRDRAAGRLNAVTALEGAGHPLATARAMAVAEARRHLRAAMACARSIPQNAGLALADVVATVQAEMTEIAVAP